MRVFWDTNLFVYSFQPDDHPSEHRLVSALVERVMASGGTLLTSTITLGEFFAGAPLRGLSQTVVEERVLQFAEVIPFDVVAAHHFGAIRADRSIRPPDAIQLACAAAAGVDIFVTNDARLSRRIVPGVPVITSLEAVPI